MSYKSDFKSQSVSRFLAQGHTFRLFQKLSSVSSYSTISDTERAPSKICAYQGIFTESSGLHKVSVLGILRRFFLFFVWKTLTKVSLLIYTLVDWEKNLQSPFEYSEPLPWQWIIPQHVTPKSPKISPGSVQIVKKWAERPLSVFFYTKTRKNDAKYPIQRLYEGQKILWSFRGKHRFLRVRARCQKSYCSSRLKAIFEKVWTYAPAQGI